jgi:hypothetical protein
VGFYFAEKVRPGARSQQEMNDSFPENGEVQTFQKVRMKPQGFYYPPDEDHGYGSLGSIIFESPELKKCEGVFALLTMNARDRDDTLKDIIRGVEQQVQGGMVEPSDLSEKGPKDLRALLRRLRSGLGLRREADAEIGLWES